MKRLAPILLFCGFAYLISKYVTCYSPELADRDAFYMLVDLLAYEYLVRGKG